MAQPRSETLLIRGWSTEFKLWWSMAKHVQVVFDKSTRTHPTPANPNNLPNAGPGGMSMCRDCCQVLSTRTCSGKTEESAVGCDFHRGRREVPIAVRSTITSVRLREMFKPSMVVERWFLEPKVQQLDEDSESEDEEDGEDDVLVGDTNKEIDMMDLGWVRRMRLLNKETKRCRKLYIHDEDGGCFFSGNPESIVHGFGPRELYFKRCDGKWLNAFGEKLAIETPHEDRMKDDRASEAFEALDHPETPGAEETRTRPQRKLQDHFSNMELPETEDSPMESATVDEITTAIDPAIEPQADSIATKVVSFATNPTPWSTVSPSILPRTTSTGSTPPPPSSSTVPLSHPRSDQVPPIAAESGTSSNTAIATKIPVCQLDDLLRAPMTPENVKRLTDLCPMPELPTNLDADPARVAEFEWKRKNILLAFKESVEAQNEREARKARKKWWRLWR
jgi:hypothetical protein